MTKTIQHNIASSLLAHRSVSASGAHVIFQSAATLQLCCLSIYNRFIHRNCCRAARLKNGDGRYSYVYKFGQAGSCQENSCVSNQFRNRRRKRWRSSAKICDYISSCSKSSSNYKFSAEKLTYSTCFVHLASPCFCASSAIVKMFLKP